MDAVMVVVVVMRAVAVTVIGSGSGGGGGGGGVNRPSLPPPYAWSAPSGAVFIGGLTL